MADKDDGLFLLEILVDKLIFTKSPCFSDKDFRTCINIECPSVAPLEICDDDPGACVANSGGPFVKNFNTGKSCLFSMKEADISQAMSKFPIKVSVYKSLPCGCLPTKIMMGEATIDMTKEFVSARKKFIEDPSGVSYQALKDSFHMTGANGDETGEIVMFLRISCFGKLIVTRFQGGNAPPNLGGSGSNAVVDRSCNPKKDFQSRQDPCACGAARGCPNSSGGGHVCPVSGGGGASGSCPPARDPYNSMPCVDPDDPCFCSGPKTEAKDKMACRNTDQYCLHVPKGGQPSFRSNQDITKKWKLNCQSENILEKQRLGKQCFDIMHFDNFDDSGSTTSNFSQISTKTLQPHFGKSPPSSFSASTFKSKHLPDSFYDSINIEKVFENNSIGRVSTFGKRETIYMTLFDDYCSRRTSGTQATAAINKCFQVPCSIAEQYHDLRRSSIGTSSFYSSHTSSYTTNRCLRSGPRCSEVYFFGRKKKDSSKPHKEGVGSSGSKTKLGKTEKSNDKHKKPKVNSQVQQLSTSGVQTKSPVVKGSSAATSTGKSVSIRDTSLKHEKPCPATMGTKGDLVATISHIKIAPREACPIHGKDPCQGPKCIVASSAAPDINAPVKVTNVTNSRRGVFELVIRRLTGAPLGKNELMLEWSPPPNRPPPCGSPCIMPCSGPSPCPTSRCKMIICRPGPCKLPKCSKRPCKKPCGPMPSNEPCRKRCCNVPCAPCPPAPCRPFPPAPCRSSCCKKACGTPCSSPCLRPCPVGYRKPRRARSQPRIRSHSKRISPCHNRSPTCPVVRCRSVPGPCLDCLGPCLPIKCCKPARCCKSSCSTCC